MGDASNDTRHADSAVSPMASGRASPTNTVTALGVQEVPLYDLISNVAMFLQTFLREADRDHDAEADEATMPARVLRGLLDVLKMPALPAVYSASSAATNVASTFHVLAGVLPTTSLVILDEIRSLVTFDEVQTQLALLRSTLTTPTTTPTPTTTTTATATTPTTQSPVEMPAAAVAFTSRLQSIDRLSVIVADLHDSVPTAKAELLEALAKALPALDVYHMVQSTVFAPSDTLAATEHRQQSAGIGDLLSRIMSQEFHSRREAPSPTLVADINNFVVAGYVQTIDALSEALQGQAHLALRASVLSLAVQQIKRLAETSADPGKFNIDLMQALMSRNGWMVWKSYWWWWWWWWWYAHNSPCSI